MLKKLVAEKGGLNADLIEDQIRPIIAVYSAYQQCGKYDLTEEQVFAFISQKQLNFDNLLLREILINPSGQMPAVDDEDEHKLLDDFLKPSSIDDTDDSAVLVDLFN